MQVANSTPPASVQHIIYSVTACSAVPLIQEHSISRGFKLFTINSGNQYAAIPPILVAGSVALTSAIYDAFESNGGVDVCVTINATALERNLTVLLSSQDGTARSEERV